MTAPMETEWRADDDAADRHAFPRRDGYPARSLCGLRWTSRFGKHGAGTCAACLAALREQIRSASDALREAEADELAAGDFYAGMTR